MKIGVVSDTHSLEIPAKVIKGLKSADLIIHAGDFCSQEEFKLFSSLKELKAVYGNCDEPALLKKLSEKCIFEVEGITIGIFHGEGSQHTVLDSVRRKFKSDKIDVAVFGHSHEALISTIEGVLYFNPGSPNDMVTAPYCSYGILDVKDEQVEAQIIKI